MSGEARQDFAFAFLSILFEGAPFILIGTLISGFIDIYMPPGMMDRFLPKNKNLAVVMAALLGAVFPVCECAVVPVIRRLVRKGLPVSCALTYMLAAPIVNPITAFSTWKAFTNTSVLIDGQAYSGSMVMTVSRLSLGFAVAVLVGLVVARLPMVWVLRKKLLAELANDKSAPVAVSTCDHDHSCCGHSHDHGHHHHHHDHHEPVAESRLVAAMRSSMKDFIDVGVYFTIGVSITALFNTGIAPGAAWLDQLANQQILAPAALMGLAFILSLCSTSDAFIAATLDKFTYGAKLAFLVFGPMFDLKLVFLYQSVMNKKFIAYLALAIFLLVGVCSIYFQWFLSSSHVP